VIENLIVLDAQQKAQALAGLARIYASNNDLWSALHAQLAADIATATVVVGMPLRLTAADIVPALADLDDRDAIEVLNLMRDAIRSSLPEAARTQFDVHATPARDLFLVGDRPDPAQTLALAAARTGGLTVEDYVSHRVAQAREGYAAASAARTAGDTWAVVVANYEADLAAYEAWLLSRSQQAGDITFVQAEIGWALTVATLEQISELPNDPDAATLLVRSRLAWSTGPLATADLAAWFDAL
jgi:hypothetical protein